MNYTELFQVLVLSLIQGVSEFLPISSSAHLILLPKLFGWQPPELLFVVAVHIGTLLAVLSYYKKIIWCMLRDSLLYFINGKQTKDNKLFFNILVATVPVGLMGLLVKYYLYQYINNINTIIISTALFAVLLLIADLYANFINSYNKKSFVGTSNAIIKMGWFQALALIPGTSRSGITLTAGLFAGLNRQEAARFSFLLSIPVIILAGGIELFDLFKHKSEILVNNKELVLLSIAVFTSGLTAYFTIKFFMNFIEKVGLMPFIVYRLLLAGFLAWIFIIRI